MIACRSFRVQIGVVQTLAFQGIAAGGSGKAGRSQPKSSNMWQKAAAYPGDLQSLDYEDMGVLDLLEKGAPLAGWVLLFAVAGCRSS